MTTRSAVNSAPPRPTQQHSTQSLYRTRYTSTPIPRTEPPTVPVYSSTEGGEAESQEVDVALVWRCCHKRSGLKAGMDRRRVEVGVRHCCYRWECRCWLLRCLVLEWWTCAGGGGCGVWCCFLLCWRLSGEADALRVKALEHEPQQGIVGALRPIHLVRQLGDGIQRTWVLHCERGLHTCLDTLTGCGGVLVLLVAGQGLAATRSISIADCLT